MNIVTCDRGVGRDHRLFGRRTVTRFCHSPFNIVYFSLLEWKNYKIGENNREICCLNNSQLDISFTVSVVIGEQCVSSSLN